MSTNSQKSCRMSPRLELVVRVANGPRESVNRVFRTAIDIVRTTRVLGRFVDADGMSAEIKSVAALAGLTIICGHPHIVPLPEVSSHEFSVIIHFLTLS
jgi:hypothetical protein